MANVFVTGGTGFVGYHLVEALAARGDTVTCLVRKTSRTEPLERFGVRFVEADLDDRESLDRALGNASVVYHLAGTTKALRRELFYRVNVDGVRNMIEVCARRESPPVCVLVSSLAAAGPATLESPRTETDPPRPISLYGKSKRAGEVEAERLADRVPITVVRPAIVFGPWDKDCFEMFRPIAQIGVHMVPGLKTRHYSLVYSGDLAQAILAAADKGERLPGNTESAPPGEGYYFVAGDECPSYAEMGRMMGHALGRDRILVIRAGAAGTWVAAAGAEVIARLWGRPLALHFDKAREALAPSWVCRADKARAHLGFKASASLQDRFRETVRWYREHGWLPGRAAQRQREPEPSA